MIKDIVISYKLSDYHYKTLYFNRVISDESSEAVEVHEVSKWLSGDIDDFMNYDKVISVLQDLSLENCKQRLMALKFLNVYVEVFNRLDLTAESVNEVHDYPVRVYLRSPMGSIAIASDDPESGSLASAVMNMYISKLTIDPAVADILGVRFELDSYNALAQSGSEGQYDSSKFLNMMVDSDSKLFIFLNKLGD